MAAIPKQPADFRQAAEETPSADIVADPPSRDEQVQGPPMAVADGVKLGIHAALRAPNQTSAPLFSRACRSAFGVP